MRVKNILRKFKKTLKKKERKELTVNDFWSSVKLGFGFNRLPYNGKEPDYEKASKIIDTYIKAGGKYFETAYMYMNSYSECIVKKCLVDKYPRDKFILCDKMPIRAKAVSQNGYEAVFNDQLSKCGVDYFDVYLLHNVGEGIYRKLEDNDAFGFLQKIKKDGRAKLVGFSFHDRADVLDKVLTDHPEVDLVQLQINYQDWESAAIQSRLCYEVATKHGKPVLVMEPLKGGNLVQKLPDEAKQMIEASSYTAPNLGLRWVASLNNVALVLSGMGSVKQVKENVKALSKPYELEAEGYKLVERVTECLKANKQVDCTNCGYCLDVCPKNIPVNDIFELMNSETRDGKTINRNAWMLYRHLVEGRGAAEDCVKCGKCEETCSQRLNIREELDKAAIAFERKKR